MNSFQSRAVRGMNVSVANAADVPRRPLFPGSWRLRARLVSSLLLVASASVAFGQDAAAPPAPEEVAAPPPDTSARIFVNRCTGCHTVGRGNLTGPDLKAATGWAEPDLRQAIEKMFDKAGPMTGDEVTGLIGLLKDPSIASRLAAEEERIALQYSAKLAPPSPDEGERLFFGWTSLTGGGMACVACHRVGGLRGGGLGTDLESIFERTGETGLRSACEKAQFPVMRAAYREKPITKQEAMHLTAFFESAGDGSKAQGAPPVLALGAALAAAVMLLTGIALRNRHSNSRRVLRRRTS